MNIIFTFLIVLVALAALMLIVALLTKKTYSIERSIVINRPSHEVFNYIRHLKNQDHFSKWVMTDPAMQKRYTGQDGTVGFVYAWDGNKKAGAGEQEITSMVEGQRLDVEVRFIRPFKGLAKTPFILEPLSDTSTKLRWGMSSSMNYPMNIALLFMNMDKMLGTDLEISLTNLKSILENQKDV